MRTRRSVCAISLSVSTAIFLASCADPCGDYCELYHLDASLCDCVLHHPDEGYGPSGYCAQHEPGTVERLGCDARGAAAHGCQVPATGVELGDLRVSCCAD